MTSSSPPSASSHPPSGASFMVGLILGLAVLFLLGQRLFHHAWAWARGSTAPGLSGYFASILFWHDVGIVLFALTLMGEGIVNALTRRPIWLILLAQLTATAALTNAAIVLITLPTHGLQILPTLAAIFCIYLLIKQLRQFRHQWRRAQPTP